MAKIRPVIAEIVNPNGKRVAIKNMIIARAIEERDVQIEKLERYLENAQKQVNTTNLILAKLQNSRWVRFGELLHFVKIGGK